MLASGSRVQTRPKPSDFSGDKILSMPSFGWEVKPSVPMSQLCGMLKNPAITRKSDYLAKFDRPFLAHNSSFR
jgi:hypothetical protein